MLLPLLAKDKNLDACLLTTIGRTRQSLRGDIHLIKQEEQTDEREVARMSTSLRCHNQRRREQRAACTSLRE